MRLSRKTKRQIRHICNNSHKSHRDFYDYFCMKTFPITSNPVKSNYKELKRLGDEHGKTITPIPMTENVMADVYQFITNHPLQKKNQKMKYDFYRDIRKYGYKITKNESIKKNI